MTTSNPNPTWYDILGVAPDATPQEVKAAWRAATDKFEPGSGQSQFRLFNDAADVLLDPSKRAEYDASLADAGGPGPSEQAVDEPAPDHAEAPPEEPVDAGERADTSVPVRSEPARRPGSLWFALVFVVLPLLTVAAVAIATTVTVRYYSHRDDAAKMEEGTSEAQAVVERALPAVLSYDYRHMDADRAKAVKYLTKSYRADYNKTFDLLVKAKEGQPGPAVKSRTAVKATVLSDGVVDADEHRVRLLVFVNQVATKDGTGGQLFQNRVAVTMVEKNGEWLIDALDSL